MFVAVLAGRDYFKLKEEKWRCFFLLLLKTNCDLIVTKSISLNSHLNRRSADGVRRVRRAILHGKPTDKTGLNGPAEKADQFK